MVILLMVCFLLLTVSDKLFADNIVYKTLDFAKAEMEKCNSYSVKWMATYGKDSWRVYYFNNNHAEWKYVKCGRKMKCQMHI